MTSLWLRPYTCEGDDVSPPLRSSGAPHGTRSFVLIVDDPDAPGLKAPRMTWVHWVLNDIPGTKHAPEKWVAKQHGRSRSGLNDWQRMG